jgi:hypothetical protein
MIGKRVLSPASEAGEHRAGRTEEAPGQARAVGDIDQDGHDLPLHPRRESRN